MKGSRPGATRCRPLWLRVRRQRRRGGGRRGQPEPIPFRWMEKGAELTGTEFESAYLGRSRSEVRESLCGIGLAPQQRDEGNLAECRARAPAVRGRAGETGFATPPRSAGNAAREAFGGNAKRGRSRPRPFQQLRKVQVQADPLSLTFATRFRSGEKAPQKAVVSDMRLGYAVRRK
jgi:hypothetical protein